MSWYLAGLAKYAVFSGRARRREFWMFYLVTMSIFLLLGFIQGFLGSSGEITNAFGLFSIIPTLAVSVRRLHDTGRSGWWVLIQLIPFGLIVLLIFMGLKGNAEENKFGGNPKINDSLAT